MLSIWSVNCLWLLQKMIESQITKLSSRFRSYLNFGSMLDRNYRGRIEDPASRRVRKTRRESLTTWPLPRWSRRAIAFVRGNSNQELSLGLSEIAMRIVFSLHIECPGNRSTIDKGEILRGKVNWKYGVTFFHTRLRRICEFAWLITELSLSICN